MAKLAAARGCAAAFGLVGDCYFDGIGTAKNLNSAARNYEKAPFAGTKPFLNLLACYADEMADKAELDEFCALQRANLALRSEINAILAQMR